MRVSSVLTGVRQSDMEAAIEWASWLAGRGSDARPMEALADWHLMPY